MNNIKDILQKEEYKGFADIFKDRMKNIKNHIFLNHDETIEEIEKMNIPIDFEMVAEDDIEMNCTIIDLIQSYKDRLTDIYCKAERDLEVIEGNYQSLIKIWVGVYSDLSSDKKREGQAEMLFGFLDPERRKRKNILLTAKMHLKNMSDKFFSISRKASIHEHVYKLVGTGYIDQPDAFENALKKRRPNINDKMKELKNKIESGAKGWDSVPNENELK